MSFESIIKDVKSKSFSPVYLFHGEESYYIDELTSLISERALESGQDEFDRSILYGKDTNVGELVSTIKRFPMMGKYHLVVVKEAQQLKKIEELEPLLQNPVPTTILVLAFRNKADQRKKWVKAIAKNGVVFASKKVPEWKLNEWVNNEAKKKGLALDPKTVAMLVEFKGADLQNISNDLDKLVMLAKEGKNIGPALIQDVIGVSRDYNIFELQDAIMTRDSMKAQLIVKNFAADPRAHPIQPIIGALFSMYSKLILLHANKAMDQNSAQTVLGSQAFYAKKLLGGALKNSYAQLVRNVSILREYDLKSKGVGATNATPQGDLMKEMVFRLVH